ncbi:MAG: hypothetical protein EZS28_025793 [Streblomastix strix]|uniref:Protein kinase domain-containing protein n=1 Tax=Streblomastix strix TaxID=222440 RepID=A0A5J4V835_9EUKA|nr:MAG: hypothetical protein EZS28_025793 [Streblomastix strix]
MMTLSKLILCLSSAKEEIQGNISRIGRILELRSNTFELIMQISSAVHQLHVNTIIHDDLKSKNVLAMKDYKDKLFCLSADFGFARKIEEERDYLTAMEVTTLYLWPQLLQSKDQSNSGAQKLMLTPSSDI